MEQLQEEKRDEIASLRVEVYAEAKVLHIFPFAQGETRL